MKCPVCHYQNNDESKFCIECGTPLFKKCEACGTTTVITAKFCPQCGKEFGEGDLSVRKYKNKLTFYDSFYFREARNGKYIIAKKDDSYLILNSNSLKPLSIGVFDGYEYKETRWTDNIFIKKNGKWGIINALTGNIVYDFEFDDHKMNDHCGDEYRVKQHGFWGKVNLETGRICVPFIYDEIDFDDRVKLHGYWGWLGKNGCSVPCEYISLSSYVFSDNIRQSQHKNGKWGVIDKYGKIILNFEYDEIEYHEPIGISVYYLRKGNLWGLYSQYQQHPCKYTKEQVQTLKWGR